MEKLVRAVDYPQTGRNGMLGFAQPANVIGGTGGEVVYVSSVSELQSQVSGSTSRIVVIAVNL